MKGDFIETHTFPLPQRKVYLSRYRALLIDKTLERLDQCSGVEGGSGGRQVCLLGFSHTMNQVKVSVTMLAANLQQPLYAGPERTPSSSFLPVRVLPPARPTTRGHIGRYANRARVELTHRAFDAIPHEDFTVNKTL
jgi:hypothetical protein